MSNNKTNTAGLEKPVLLAVFLLWLIGVFSLVVASYYLSPSVTGFAWSIGSPQAGIILVLLFFFCIFISMFAWTALTFQTRAEDFALQFDEEIYQERLRTMHADKLASLGRMSSGVAHEINNPLAIISGKIQTLLRQNNNEKNQNDFENIMKQIERIARIVKALSGSATDSANEAAITISLSRILNESYDFVRSQLESKNIQISIVCDAQLKTHCKPTQVSQILYNLFSNSIDAVEFLNDKWIHIEVQDEGTYVKLRFIDSGGPLNPDLAFKIMDPFFTTKDMGKGTGLGLSVSRSQAISNQGSLEYDLKARTTTFIFKLPKATT